MTPDVADGQTVRPGADQQTNDFQARRVAELFETLSRLLNFHG